MLIWYVEIVSIDSMTPRDWETPLSAKGIFPNPIRFSLEETVKNTERNPKL